MKKILLILVAYCCLYGCVESSDSGSQASGSGVGGSTARFVIQNNFLIVVEDSSIRSFNIDDAMNPRLIDQSYTTGPRLETVFPYSEDLVLIGTNQGAVITRISSQGFIEGISFASHFTSRDPVVAANDIMYVTIRPENGQSRFVDASGVLLSDGSNRLIVYDITDLENPQELTQLGIENPTGLSLSGDRLYVCFEEGLRIYDVTEPSDPQVVTDYADFPCNDVIAAGSDIIATGDAGIQLLENQQDVMSLLSSIQPGN
ncbi:MAG: hypothetical protein ACJA10_000188 [Oleispira sp.]|jgi:hypothetical protein